MANNYGEIFCDAVQTIVNEAVAKLEFDISRECTIVKIKDRAYGKYEVSDGSMAPFEAIASEGSYFEVGDRVIVSIPKGDYNEQISILTKIVDEWSGPAGFVRPLDTVIRCTENIALKAVSAALTANGDISRIEILNLEEQKLFGFHKIGISAKFKSQLSGLNVIDGNYGLIFHLIEKDGDKEKRVQQFLFSNNEMLGNPYEFSSFFTQEYAFNIPEGFDKVNQIIVEFYQDNNFIDGNKNKIDASPMRNLYVEDLEIYFGYDSERELNEIVEIRSEYLTYSTDMTKEINLSWFHKVNANKMEEISEDTFDTKLHSIRWYRYVSGCSEDNTDEYGGPNWYLLSDQTDRFIIDGLVKITKTEEKFKAICLLKTYPLINDPTYEVIVQYPSNILTFENTNEETSGGEAAGEVIRRDLSLVFSDNSYGNYFIYDQNGEIIDDLDLKKNRSIVLRYKDAEINEDNFIDITNIKWSLPDKQNSMITYTGGENDFESQYEFKYQILDDLDTSLSDNTISCSIYVSGQLYVTLNETLRFGKRGTNGTTTTFVLEMLDGKNALVPPYYTQANNVNSENYFNYFEINDEGNYVSIESFNENTTYYELVKSLRVQAILVRDTGKIIYLSESEKKNIEWELIYPHNNIGLVTNGDNKDKDWVTLTLDNGPIPDDNYTILKASYKYNDGPTLETYLPIPIRSKYYDKFIGETQIIYNHQGIPKYNNGPYKLSSIVEALFLSGIATKNDSLTDVTKYEEWYIDNSTFSDYYKLQIQFKTNSTGQTFSDGLWFVGQDGNNDTAIYYNGVIANSTENNILSWEAGDILFFIKSNNTHTYDNKNYPIIEYAGKNSALLWQCKNGQDNPNPVTLKSLSEFEYGLSAPHLYCRRQNDSNVIDEVVQDKVCISCRSESGEILWSQPILIMQSQYDFAMLNSWDGSLTIDENNGTILSAMLGAGRKNEQNQFSGVLIGDLQGGTDLEETETMTGVYGLQNGIITYGLRENGSAFFGAYNKGRIEIDGTSGTIKSADGNGMEIDLDAGSITAKNFNLTAGDTKNGQVIIDSSIPKLSLIKDNDKIEFSGINGVNIEAKSFNLKTGNTNDGDGITISNTEFTLKKGTDKISFLVDDNNNGGLQISAANFNLSAGAWDDKGRIEINSNPGDNGYYFAAGLDKHLGSDGAFGNTNERYFTIGPNNFEIKTPNFWIKTDGSVQIKGHITATSGDIGGWKIESGDKNGNTGLYYGDSLQTATIGMSPNYKGADGKGWAFWSGDTFRVDLEGKLYATGADIQGTIYADEGRIGGLSLDGGVITAASEGSWIAWNQNPFRHSVPSFTSEKFKISNWGSTNNSVWYNYYYDISNFIGALQIKTGNSNTEVYVTPEEPSGNGEYQYSARGSGSSVSVTVNKEAKWLLVNTKKANEPTITIASNLTIDASGKLSATSIKLNSGNANYMSIGGCDIWGNLSVHEDLTAKNIILSGNISLGYGDISTNGDISASDLTLSSYLKTPGMSITGNSFIVGSGIAAWKTITINETEYTLLANIL